MALPHRRPDGNRTRGPDWAAGFDIENVEAVAAYVAEHPSVAPLLTDAPAYIASIFRNTEPPRLRLAIDPEAGDCWLAVAIPVSDDGPAALQLIDAFDEQWWLARMPLTDATLVFDVTAA
jgi:hypothetical protein